MADTTEHQRTAPQRHRGAIGGDRNASRRSRSLSRRARRLRDHVALGAASLAGVWAIYAAIDSKDTVYRVSMATAYVGLALLVATLAFGPVAALKRRRYPVSTDIRRDFGIWSALVAIAHVVAGLQVHLRGKMWEYFLRPNKGILMPRIDPFGAANYTGLAAVVILATLLATSNDASLRRLGTGRWRSLHALVTWSLVLTLFHAVVYQFIEKRRWQTVVLLLVLSVAAVSLRIIRIRGSRTG
jgi:sulfoxide reductase heme-binding subunit YedZ